MANRRGIQSLICLLLMLLASGAALARDREAVDSARSAAVSGLRSEIGRQPLGEGASTVDWFIDVTESEAKLMDVLRGAQQIGGPRWIDDRTCQVKLEIPANRIADLLVKIATTYKGGSPLAPEQMQMRLRDWRGKRFSAIGTSDGAQTSEIIEATTRGAIAPDPRFDPEQPGRREAILAARADAQRRVIASIRTVPLDGRDVGMLLDQPEVSREVESYLATRPLRRVEFRDDQRVEVLLAVHADEMVDVVRSNAKDVPADVDDEQWLRARDEMGRRLDDVWGSARTDEPAMPKLESKHAAALRVPATWDDEPIQTEGNATNAGSKLKTARAAEDVARLRMMDALMSLKLEDGRTLGDAAREDRRVGDAVARALDEASVFRAIYHEDGSATVKINLDLYNLTADLRRIE